MAIVNENADTPSPDIPTLRAERWGHQIRVWCPHCRPSHRGGRRGDWHVHGAGGSKGPDLGHRGAHCYDPTSPFLSENGGRGYFLRLDEEDEDRG